MADALPFSHEPVSNIDRIMDFAAILPFAVFIGFALAAWALISQFSGESSRATERLDELRNPNLRNRERSERGTGMGGMIERAAPVFSQALKPKSELEQSNLKLRLANAGFNSPHAPEIYLAIKFAALIGGLIIGSSFGLTQYGLTQKGIVALVIGGGAGFYLPELVLAFLRSQRREKIFLSLPDALDLLVVCVEAGLGLDAGMRRVAEELNDTAPDLCAEFNLCNFQLQMGRPAAKFSTTSASAPGSTT